MTAHCNLQSVHSHLHSSHNFFLRHILSLLFWSLYRMIGSTLSTLSTRSKLGRVRRHIFLFPLELLDRAILHQSIFEKQIGNICLSRIIIYFSNESLKEGPSQVLALVLSPFPQVTEHSDHGAHSLQNGHL